MLGPLTPKTYTATLAAEHSPRFACQATSPDELAAWQTAFRSALHEALGLPMIAQRPAADLAPQKHDETTLNDHIRELWTIQTEKDFRLPFYLLRPRAQTAPQPLVLTPHGHGLGAKQTYVGIYNSDEERAQIDEGERDIARQAVREGYIAIAPDMRAFADLRTAEDREAGKTCSCDALQKFALLQGRTLIGERVWDIMRLIDYAATRREVDTQRIAITGNSGGGTASLFAAAIDERINVAIPGSYFCTFADSIGSLPHCACNFIPGLLTLGEMHDIAGLIAPRPFLAVNGQADPIFPIDATRHAYERLRAIYHTANAADRCRLYVGDAGHRYYKAPVWPFVRECFANQPASPTQ